MGNCGRPELWYTNIRELDVIKEDLDLTQSEDTFQFCIFEKFVFIISELLSQNNFGEERTKVERMKNHPVITSNIKNLSARGWQHKPKDRTRAVSSGT